MTAGQPDFVHIANALQNRQVDNLRHGDAPARRLAAPWNNGRFVEVVRVRQEQGRKPTEGETLHLVADDETLKVNSLDAVRITPSAGR